jgi:phosphate transport system substrate-binding protein
MNEFTAHSSVLDHADGMPRFRFWAAALLFSVTAHSQTVRCWGSAQMAALMDRWQGDYSRAHPGIRFELHLYGAASAMGGLYAGAADLVLSREIWPIESLAFEQVLGYKPLAVEVATGSFDVPTKSDSLDIFVHKSSPVSRLTVAELGAIFSGRDARFSHTYGYLIDNAGTRCLQQLTGIRLANSYREFGNLAKTGSVSGRIDAGQLILDALADDPQGIAVSNARYANASVKMVAISPRQGEPYVMPSRETVRTRNYPLIRSVFVFLRKDSPPAVVTFVKYVLSAAGQRQVAEEGDYLPLTADLIRRQSFILHSFFPE